MKKIVFSFDDGRKDTFDTSLSILKKYGFVATINIATDFILNPALYDCFASGNGEAMTIEEVVDTQRRGFEIASHGHKHTNTVEDCLQSLAELNKWGVDTSKIGFASPFSKLTDKNMLGFDSLLNKELLYIRSGRQVRREGLFYSGLYFLMERLKSNYLFYLLNKKMIYRTNDTRFVYGITVTKRTNFKQIQYLINKMPDNSAIILIFHSVLDKNQPGYGKDKWFYNKEHFIKLCDYISSTPNVSVVTTKELFDGQ